MFGTASGLAVVWGLCAGGLAVVFWVLPRWAGLAAVWERAAIRPAPEVRGSAALMHLLACSGFLSFLCWVPQVKTIDTPRVRPLAQTELKKRQMAVDAYEVAVRKGALKLCLLHMRCLVARSFWQAARQLLVCFVRCSHAPPAAALPSCVGSCIAFAHCCC